MEITGTGLKLINYLLNPSLSEAESLLIFSLTDDLDFAKEPDALNRTMPLCKLHCYLVKVYTNTESIGYFE